MEGSSVSFAIDFNGISPMDYVEAQHFVGFSFNHKEQNNPANNQNQ